jgi:hypothetical protein
MLRVMEASASGGKRTTWSFPRLAAVGRVLASRRWFQAWARWGLVVKGVIFLMIGALAGLAALDLGGGFINAFGVLQEVANHAFGIVLLAVMMTGNLGYALFKIVAALCDTDRKGSDAIGWFKRLGMLIKSLIYVGLAVLAAQMLLGVTAGDGSGDAFAASIVARMIRHLYGDWLVIALGIYLVLMGLMQFYMIYTAYIRRRLALEHLTVPMFRLITALGRFGYAARGIVALVTGGFLCVAGWYADPSSARGFGGALAWLGEQAYVPYLLGLVAAGLCSYGVFEILLARFRRIVVP